MNVLDLFSGIGGFSLGLERAGMRTVAFCEIEPFCRAVLRKHWPTIPIHADIRNLTAGRLRWVHSVRDIDVICGGFPCQDISAAGKKTGIGGERSGLWSEYARIIGELRPRYVIVENVAALLNRGMDKVLGDLAAIGYDAEWHCIPASAIGAPHRRDRVWIVAYPSSQGGRLQSIGQQWRGHPTVPIDNGAAAPLAHTASEQFRETWQHSQRSSERPSSRGRILADANSSGLPHGRQTGEPPRSYEAVGRLALSEFERCGGAWWATEPDVGRVANGVPDRVDRLTALGNAIVPQIAEIIGRAILAAN